jgi:hypothetical protein
MAIRDVLVSVASETSRQLSPAPQPAPAASPIPTGATVRRYLIEIVRAGTSGEKNIDDEIDRRIEQMMRSFGQTGTVHAV